MASSEERENTLPTPPGRPLSNPGSTDLDTTDRNSPENISAEEMNKNGTTPPSLEAKELNDEKEIETLEPKFVPKREEKAEADQNEPRHETRLPPIVLPVCGDETIKNDATLEIGDKTQDASPTDIQGFSEFDKERSDQIINHIAAMKPEDTAALANNSDGSRINLSLLLEASAAAAEAEKKAESQGRRPEKLRRVAKEKVETDQYITEAIHRVQTMPRNERSVEIRPVDRRDRKVPNGWSRLGEIEKDPQLLGECRRLVRGTQGCGRECDAKFTNLVDFARHVDEKHDVNFRPFLCPKDNCPWAIIGFHERSECTRHIRTKHYRAMYYCEYQGCTKVYNRSDAFRRHVRQAHANPESRFNRLAQRSEES